MRFVSHIRKEKHPFSPRIIKRFALFPIKIKNEIRWMEVCYIKQLYWELWDEYGYENIEFVTKEQYDEYNSNIEREN